MDEGVDGSSPMDSLVFQNSLIARRYLRGWFVIDFISSIPLDTLSIISGADIHTILRLNKVRAEPAVVALTISTGRYRQTSPIYSLIGCISEVGDIVSIGSSQP